MVASMFFTVYSFDVVKGEVFTIDKNGFEALLSCHDELGSVGLYVTIMAWFNLLAGVAAIVMSLLDLVVFGNSTVSRHMQTVSLILGILASLLYSYSSFNVCSAFDVRTAFIWDASLAFLTFLGVAVVSFVYVLVHFFKKERE